jgi:hypothetical protein
MSEILVAQGEALGWKERKKAVRAKMTFKESFSVRTELKPRSEM